MSNKKGSFFNPGGKHTVVKSILPSSKVNSMYNPTFHPKVSKNTINTYTQNITSVKTTRYYKTGKPGKPNVGSMDRINKIKAQAMK
tara:strand:+ start:173 stop:430 length:258 start_codon:yes stop_codon:yes gene_type:complete